MPVPRTQPNPRISAPRAFTALALFCACILPARAAKPPVPTLSIPLEDLGYQGAPAHYLLVGDSILTLHFVDDTHLLATFTTRGLLSRLPDAEETDNDQNVTAVLLELPTGKLLGKTVWRERDRGQYLWAIGHGRFILRNRSKLTLLDPLLGLAAGESGKPFEEQTFVELHRTIGYIAVSPGLISVESTATAKPKPTPTSSSSSSSTGGLTRRTEPPPATSVQINFFRTIYEPQPGKPDRLIIQSSGVVLAPNLIDIPATADGYLDISKDANGYLFDFQGHGGKRLELSGFSTSCVPRPHFISPTEFIAFGCRGSEDRQQMAAFNLHGDSLWVNAFPNHHLFPYLVSAPAAGRFALSRTVTLSSYVDPDNLVPAELGPQEVSVHQSWDGRTLFKMPSTPFQRSGQNFDLSPDGQTLAIIHDGKIQTYKLPALSRKDEDAIKLAATFAPERTDARISLGGKPSHQNGRPEEKAADESPVTSKPEAATNTVASQAVPASPAPAASQLASSPAQSQAASPTPPSRNPTRPSMAISTPPSAGPHPPSTPPNTLAKKATQNPPQTPLPSNHRKQWIFLCFQSVIPRRETFCHPRPAKRKRPAPFGAGLSSQHNLLRSFLCENRRLHPSIQPALIPARGVLMQHAFLHALIQDRRRRAVNLHQFALIALRNRLTQDAQRSPQLALVRAILRRLHNRLTRALQRRNMICHEIDSLLYRPGRSGAKCF